jgi:PAS domain S-box-containing protein
MSVSPDAPSEQLRESERTPSYEDLLARLAEFEQQHASLLQAVEARRESEAEYRQLFANMQEGFAYCRIIRDGQGHPTDFVYLRVNDAFATLTGLENVTGKRVSEVIPGIRELHPELFETYGRVAATGQPEKFEVEFKPIGQWLAISVYSPKKEHFVAVFDNVTGRKQIEQALQRGEALLRTVIDTTPDAVYAKDADSRVVLINPAALKVVGKPAERILGHDDRDFYDDPAVAAAVIENDKRVMAAGVAERCEETLLTPEGYRDFLDTKAPWRDADGRIIGIVGVSRDVTEQKQADRALQTTLQRFYTVLSSMYSGVLLVTNEGRVEFTNRALCHFFALQGAPADLVGLSSGEMMMNIKDAYQHPDEAIARIREILDRGEPVRGEEIAMRGGGTCLRDFVPLKVDGRPYGRLWIHFDITERKQAEAALKQSEARHRALFDNSIDAIFATAPDGRVFAANRVACQTFGMTEEELIRAGREGITDWSDPRHGPALAERARSGHLRRELGYVRKDGTKFTAEVSSVILPDRTTSFVIMRDITERKQAEETLRESEERFRAIFEHGSDAILVTDPAGMGRVLAANPAACRMFGRSADEFVGLDRQSHIDTSDPRLAEMLSRRDGQGRAVAEVTCQRKDGSTFSAEFSTALLTDRMGQRRSVATIRDITERKRAEEALRRFELLASHTRDIVLFMRREDGRILEANVAAQDAYGYSREEMLSLSLRDLRAPDTRPLSEEQMGIAEVRGILFETVHQRKDGSTFPAEVSSSGATIDGTRTLISVVRDITERKRAEDALREANLQLAEADRRKNDFMAVLSHELRNPLAPIRNSTYILERAAPGGEQAKRALAVIDRQAGQLARLVDDLLDVTRITRNKIQLQCQTVDLNELVQHALEDQRSLFEKAEVHLDLRPAPQPVLVNADRNRLAQVIGNLLQNAAKFAGRGGATGISISVDATEKEAVMRVADNGIGMSPEMVSRLFQPFSQADSTLDRRKGGLGLGLALAKGLVELHQGSVTAHSAGLGQGAEFIVRLPLAPEQAAAPQAGESATRRRRRVLIIEDNIDAADSLRDVLEFGEHQVEVAYNGPQGIAKAHEFLPEVVLCDIGLPGMDGYQVARAFRADAALKGTFLVALSGYALPEDLQQAQAAGFNGHLAKPPSLETLERVLADVVP